LPGTSFGADYAASGGFISRSKQVEECPLLARQLESVCIDHINKYSAEPKDMRTTR